MIETENIFLFGISPSAIPRLENPLRHCCVGHDDKTSRGLVLKGKILSKSSLHETLKQYWID